MSPLYAVFTFLDDVLEDPDDEITSEVPSSWVTKDEKHCWWPSSMKNVPVLISKQIQPDPKNKRWQLCKIKLDGYYADLEAARKKAQTLSSSDESDERKKGRGERSKRKTRLPEVTEDNSESSQDLPVEKRGTVLARPPNCAIEDVDDDDLISLSDLPITFEDSITNESHLEASLSGLPGLPPTRSGAATNGVVLLDALLSSTSDTTDPMMTLLSTPSRARVNEKFPFASPVRSGSSQTAGPSVELNRTSSVMETLKRHSLNLLRQPTGETSKTLMPSTQEPDSSIRKFIEESTEKILRSIAGVTLQLEKFNERLGRLENQIGIPALSVIHNANHPLELRVSPFKTTDQIEDFEARLLNHKVHPQLKSNLMQLLIRVGGNCLKDNLIRVLKMVFSNEIAVKSSWLGLRKNFQISKLNVTKMVKDAVAVKYPHTDKEFEELASEWFRQANQRFKREQKNQEK